MFERIFNLLEIPIMFTNEEQADLIIFSCFNQTEPVPGKKNLFFTHENSFTGHDSRKEKYGLPMIGYCLDTPHSCSLPFWFLVYHELCGNVIRTKGRIDDVCSMYHMKYPHREAIINYYRADRISCGGHMILCREKLCTLSRYKYNIAVENSFYPAYVTEKVVDAILAGCLPIYLGGDLTMTPFNLRRIIHAYDDLPDNYDELFDMPVMNSCHREMFETRKHKLRSFLERVMN